MWLRPGDEVGGVVLVVRRQLGGAVVRNRVKRRLRHICRAARLSSGVVLVQSGAVSAGFGELREEVLGLFGLG